MANIAADLEAELKKEHLVQIEYLFAQSAQGFHLVFDREALTEVLKKPADDDDFFSFQNLGKIQGVLADFIQKESLAAKEDFLRSLPPETYELLVRTYFNIVENSILQSGALTH